ncbi:DUF952 domain-containing protein [Nocardioides stalactiti]|uniref:DUF952 domain-containing protein n=1 Tax=Nocardioides stalactiti TaxID=2755356 RepID=UPI0015FF3FB3|nr:DUF952 domain-containing protein [Nocardioides stalactiti]
MATIFHLSLASDWAAAQRAGAYTISTLGRTLAEEGYIHASRGDQWPGVRARFYADVTEPLLLLQIDTDLLGVPVVEEPPAPGMTETFPHIYGPIPVSAVVKAIPLDDGTTAASSTPETATTPSPEPTPGAVAPAPTPDGSFGRFFLEEMFRNMTLVLLVMATTLLGFAAGSAFGSDVAPAVGILVGLVGGAALARAIYVRRR